MYLATKTDTVSVSAVELTAVNYLLLEQLQGDLGYDAFQNPTWLLVELHYLLPGLRGSYILRAELSF